MLLSSPPCVSSTKNTLRAAHFLLLSGCILLVCLAWGACSSEKFLHEGECVLSDVRLTSTDKNLKASHYRSYVRQQPNTRWFTWLKVPLGVYCLSSADSVKARRGWSKLMRKIGEPPVIADSSLTAYSQSNLQAALRGEGYLHARVDTLLKHRGYKTNVEYQLTPGRRYYVSSLSFSFDDERIRSIARADSANSLLRLGMPLNLQTLSSERDRIIRSLRDKGYYYLTKEYVTYDIDTLRNSLAAQLTLRFARPAGVDSARCYVPQRYDKVRIYEDYAVNSGDSLTDSLFYRGLWFHYNGKHHLNKRVAVYHVAQRTDSLFNETRVQETNGTLNALPAVNYTSVRVQPALSGDSSRLDCNIHIQRRNPHSIGLDLEGTNTAGDLGAATALTYTNRNIFGSSEQLAIKARLAYEAITGLEGYNNQNYIEFSADGTLRFPTLLLPFVSIEKKRRLKATSEASVMYDTQNRPEFHRRVLTALWAYNWALPTKSGWRHRFDLFSLNYVYMPWISDTFRKDYLSGDDPYYSILRYSYEDLFILRMGYSFTYNSLQGQTALDPSAMYHTNGYQIKVSTELAGNLLYAFARAAHIHQGADGSYKLFGIAFSQYAKIDLDFSKSWIIDEKNSLAFHAAFGLGIPYGNSNILPYEKRYFSGGANSVRGWSVRELGPGSYKGKDGKIDFINQTGNLKLDFSIEWRTFLFWKLHSALFVDAGNVWNTRSYAGMDGAQFRWNRFYKEIAVAYGIGLRLNFDYFILRLDGGMKAIDPSVPSGRLHYPISKPNFSRDFTLHFAVGLPF